MGYDDGECLLCYVKYGCNDSSNQRAEICASCIEEHGSHFTGRVQSVLSRNLSCLKTNCALCKKDKYIIFDVSVCNPCIGLEAPKSEDDDEDE